MVMSLVACGMPVAMGVVPNKPIICGKERMISADCYHIAARISTRQLHGGCGHVRAIFGKLDHLRIWQKLQQLLCTLKLNRGRAA